MQQYISEQIHPGIITIQGMLRKIDCLRLPIASRRDVESILVRQVSKEIDRALPWQAGHGRRTAAISLLIGQAVGLTLSRVARSETRRLPSRYRALDASSPPDHRRANCLESESYVTIQNHPRLGALLLEPFFFLREASVLVAHHHERWDGSGYPYGIRGRFIPLGARILAIADAFDAIRIPEVSNPVARNKIALRIIRVAAGTQFDPLLVEALCQLRESIPGSDLVESTMRNCFDSQ